MTAARWGDWGPNWSIGTRPAREHQSVLERVLVCDEAWRKLTRAQREVLLSAAADAPIIARADVLRRLHDRGLIVAPTNPAELTAAARLVIQWRLL